MRLVFISISIFVFSKKAWLLLGKTIIILIFTLMYIILFIIIIIYTIMTMPKYI